MPTRNRRRLVEQAIRYFLRQDYPNRELIVVDDGEETVADLMPSDSRVRYERLERRQSIGAKRNLACRLGAGDLIAHWDDDDWMGPERLSLQVSELLRSDADVCGLRNLLYYNLDAGEAWMYRYSSDAPWLAGGTLLYRRSAWVERPFREVDIGEDALWVRSIPADRLQVIADEEFYVALIHSGNTSTKNLRDRRWQPQPLDRVRSILGADREFYAALRNSRLSSTDVRSTPSSITLCASFLVYDGYGSMAEYLARGLFRAGATVDLDPISIDQRGMSEEFREIVERSSPQHDAPILYFSWLHAGFDRYRHARELFVNTMWESSLLPADWPAKLNRARCVVAPTRFVADVFRRSGVKVPIEVVPQGVDPAIYTYAERPDRPGFTTLIVGTVIPRKHVAEGIAAWKRAFADDTEARLIIKSRFHYGNYTPDDPRIRFVDENEATRGIPHWYHEADLLMALGNEGFGLPLIEAMATGLPVIALRSEGQTDVCDDAVGLTLPVDPARWEEYHEHPFGRCGVRGVPDVDQTVERLRWASAHRDEARAMGREAAAWAVKHRNIWDMGPAILDVMERHARPQRPLRRTKAMWTPSWRTPCGIAEYTDHLAAGIPGAVVTSLPPDPRGLRLLHVQHHDGIFDEHALADHLRRAQRERVTVIVTEHAVRSTPRAWEREADALVSLTKQGADTLRLRWPRKRVEHIAHGCPTWFPPRKPRRGRTIGAFGFLEHHKGFWRLLDVLRRDPEADLLLFSHAKSKSIENEWEEAAHGLPVRRFSGFLPVEEIARRLAAEADILVFWYDEVDHASASGAVRVGLATGVPTLASPTSWFSDMHEATYRPQHLYDGVERLLDDPQLRNETAAAAYAYCNDHSWLRTAERHLELWRSLEHT